MRIQRPNGDRTKISKLKFSLAARYSISRRKGLRAQTFPRLKFSRYCFRHSLSILTRSSPRPAILRRFRARRIASRVTPNLSAILTSLDSRREQSIRSRVPSILWLLRIPTLCKVTDLNSRTPLSADFIFCSLFDFGFSSIGTSCGLNLTLLGSWQSL